MSFPVARARLLPVRAGAGRSAGWGGAGGGSGRELARGVCYPVMRIVNYVSLDA